VRLKGTYNTFAEKVMWQVRVEAKRKFFVWLSRKARYGNKKIDNVTFNDHYVIKK
jgi:hypothetical protein